MQTELIVVAAGPGSGKTTLLREILRSRKATGYYADLAGELLAPEELALVELRPPLQTEGARAIARAALALHPGEWLALDDAEDYFSPWLGYKDPMRTLLIHRRNIGLSINILLGTKSITGFPQYLRGVTTFWIVRPDGDPDADLWLRRAGIPTEPLPSFTFWAGRKGGPWEKVDANSLDTARLLGY